MGTCLPRNTGRTPAGPVRATLLRACARLADRSRMRAAAAHYAQPYGFWCGTTRRMAGRSAQHGGARMVRAGPQSGWLFRLWLLRLTYRAFPQRGSHRCASAMRAAITAVNQRRYAGRTWALAFSVILVV